MSNINYQSVNDAAAALNNGLYAAGKTNIWYCKPEIDHWDRRTLKADPNRLRKTHVLVGRIAARSKDEVFALMQGENWSPNGESRGLISKLGLGHTSMSIGDVIKIDDKVFICRPMGWEEVVPAINDEK